MSPTELVTPFPKVSIVLPTFNRAESTARAIRSIRRQTVENWELIVVDDGSNEDVECATQRFCDGRIRIIRHENNKGAPAARNTGLDAARAEFVAFIDSDAEWAPKKLEQQLPLFNDSNVGVVTCGMALVSAKREKTIRPTARGRVFGRVLRRRVGVWDTSTFIVRASVGARFDESFPAYQDFDYLAQISRHHAVDFASEVLVKVHTDTPGPRVSDRNLEGRLCVLQKYEEALSERPETLSHHHVRIALKYYYRCDMRAARRHLSRAALAYPSRMQHWIWLVGAGLGRHGLWLALRLCHHETTE